jgi:hypothetical protein
MALSRNSNALFQLAGAWRRGQLPVSSRLMPFTLSSEWDSAKPTSSFTSTYPFASQAFLLSSKPPAIGFNAAELAWIRQKQTMTEPKPVSQQALPSAKDCDDAMEGVELLQGRLSKLKRPPTVKTYGESIKAMTVATFNGILVVFRFILSLPSYYSAYMAMSKDEWKAKKAGWKKAFKHELHHYWVKKSPIEFVHRPKYCRSTYFSCF